MIESIIGYLLSPALSVALSHLLDTYGGEAWHNASSGAKLLLANVVMGVGAYAGYFLQTHITSTQMATYDPLVGAVVTTVSLIIGLVFHAQAKAA
jgi:uncharacterized membrane protein